jgi:glycosyltransferase involved in cell wall biosynthesis
LKVLLIAHNHPSAYPGGAEEHALELYREMRDSHDVEPVLLARVGAPLADQFVPHAGTPFGLLDSDTHQLAVYTDDSDFDWLNLTLREKRILTGDLHDFLLAQRPDVIHVHHVAYLGVDLFRLAKNALPDVPIVFTLHDYFPICHRGGVMVRTRDDELCTHASPRRCNECFPDISPADFFMRKRFIESHLSLVDLFVAPSRFLLERYVEWGIPREKIVYSEHGRSPAAPVEAASRRAARNQLGFFGQLNPWKGITVLLKAMKSLADEAAEGGPEAIRDTHLWVHGTKVEGHFDGFDQELDELIEATEGNVTLGGRYSRKDLPELIANVDWIVVPSIWWENSPLVVQEAFQHGKPVICSGIGALAEKVTDGVNGLHFQVGSAESLASTLRRAVRSRDLWSRLRAGIPEVRSVEDQAVDLIDVYRRLLAEKALARA